VSGAVTLLPSLRLHSIDRENLSFFCLNLGYAYFLPQPHSLLSAHPTFRTSMVLAISRNTHARGDSTVNIRLLNQESSLRVS
jgi:hypothetical protein